MTDREVYLLINQSTALQVDIADALFHAEMGPGGDYYSEGQDGSSIYTDEGEDEMDACYSFSEFLLNDCGIGLDG